MDYMMAAYRLKILAFALLYLLGCNAPDVPDVPDTPDAAIEINVPAFNDDQPILAYTLAKHTTAVSPDNPSPVPNPSGPKVGDTCDNCGGSGKVGDGTVFVTCSSCKGDGKLDEGDPGLSSSSQEKIEEEKSVVVQYAREDAFNEWVSKIEEFQAQAENKHNELAKGLNENNAAIQAKFDESQAKIDQLNGRISELEARISAVDAECNCDEKKVEPEAKETPAYGYKLSYKGNDYIWDGDSSFIAENGWKITYPHLKGATGERLENEPPVRICPEGEVCSEVKIEKFDLSSKPALKVIPKTEPSPPTFPQSFYDPYYPVRPSRTWWSGCHSWVHLNSGEHRGKFNPDWLRRLDWPELQSLHSDDHDNRTKWQYVVR